LSNLFPRRQVWAKCEHLALSGCFKIRGAVHLLERLRREGGSRQLVVPSMGNTALGVAVGARAFGFPVLGVVPQTISRAKDEKLQALGVELLKIAGGGSDLIRTATEVARERGAYFVHPHLDPLWTDGYQAIAREVLEALPACRSLVFPVGGGGLLMGLTEYLARHPAPVALVGCEAYNYPTYASFQHSRSRTVAEGLMLDDPHPVVQRRIAEQNIAIHMVHDKAITDAMRLLYETQGLLVEPSSAVTVALVGEREAELAEPVCVVLTGENITREDFFRLLAGPG
jgi:threonine dehydratase